MSFMANGTTPSGRTRNSTNLLFYKPLGLADGEFFIAYEGNRQEANDLAIEWSPVGAVLPRLLESSPTWTGTASDLLAALDEKADEPTKSQRAWPKDARVPAGIIKRLAPNLRRAGIAVDTKGHSGRGTAKRKVIKLVRRNGESIDPTCPTPRTLTSSGVDGGDGAADVARSML